MRCALSRFHPEPEFLSEIGEKDDKQHSRYGYRFSANQGTRTPNSEHCNAVHSDPRNAVVGRSRGRWRKLPSEWARDVLLRVAVDESRGEMEMHIFTELVGIQMLLMSALDPLLRGEKMAQEQLAALYRRVQTTKATQAQELLAKRNLKKEK